MSQIVPSQHADDIPSRPAETTEPTSRVRALEAEVARLRSELSEARAPRASTAREQDFRAIAEHLPQLVWSATPAGEITYVNRLWRDALGDAPASTRALREHVHPDDLPVVKATWQAGLRWGDPFEGEFRLSDGRGGYRWHLWHGTPIRHPVTGHVNMWTGTAVDIDDRKRMEVRLRDNESRMTLASEAAGFGTWDLNHDTGEIRWSSANYAAWGRESRHPSGGYLSLDEVMAMIHPGDRERIRAETERTFAEDAPFRCEFRIPMPDGTVRWLAGLGRRVPARPGMPPSSRMTGINVDVTERRRDEERRRLMHNELNHRVKNTLAVVQSMAIQSFRGIEREQAPGPDTVRAAKADFEGRLFALAKAHDVLTRESWEGAGMRDVVHDAFSPYRSGDHDPFDLCGPNLRLAPAMALGLALALHELATNAVKYGSLSVPEGRVSLEWSLYEGDVGPRLGILWREAGGPAVEPPARRGFGSRLIERSLDDDGAGSVEVAYDPGGVTCTFDVSLPSPEPAPLMDPNLGPDGVAA